MFENIVLQNNNIKTICFPIKFDDVDAISERKFGLYCFWILDDVF